MCVSTLDRTSFIENVTPARIQFRTFVSQRYQLANVALQTNTERESCRRRQCGLVTPGTVLSSMAVGVEYKPRWDGTSTRNGVTDLECDLVLVCNGNEAVLSKARAPGVGIVAVYLLQKLCDYSCTRTRTVFPTKFFPEAWTACRMGFWVFHNGALPRHMPVVIDGVGKSRP